ncbi:unannotated protein [freshwater metagenome]|uniref:Unannotated protein n=1 Tax=freshwater metagenome TaxID=449393 RepID=A0A6J7E7M6_9ZZZZ|nr:hypothetical protein [Actinomycetota bacterium]
MSSPDDDQIQDPAPAPAESQEAVAQAPEPAAESEATVEATVEATAAESEANAEATAEAPVAVPKAPTAAKGGKGRRRGRRPDPHKDVPRSRAPLPLDELRDASRATLEIFGRDAVRDSIQILSPRERQDISALVAQDEDHRPRARNVANGSLGAGRIDKAMSATIVSMAKIEDLWALTLDKELASQKLGRIRQAKQRDQQRAKRNEERSNRADRVSRDDLAKAQDGSVGATIRIVTDEARQERRAAQKQAKAAKRESVLDKLGY